MISLFRSRLFFKYLASYFIVLIIPILMLFLLVYQTFLELLTKEISAKNTDMLMQVKNNIDSEYQQLIKISYQIQDNPDLSKLAINENVLNARTALRSINNYAAVNSFAHEIIVYHHGDRYMYSTSSTFTSYNLFNNLYKFENKDETHFNSVLNSAADVEVWPASNVTLSNLSTERFIPIFINLPHGNPSKNSTITFLVNETTFQSFLRGVVEKHHGNVLVLDRNKNIITSLTHGSDIVSAEFKSILTGLENLGTRKITLNNTPYYISKVFSESTGWSYVTLIPINTISHQLDYIKGRALYSLLLIITLGSLLIYSITYLNYNPLRKLKQYTDEKLGRFQNSDEIDSVKSAFEHLYITSNLIKNRLENSRTDIRNALLFGLIKGDYSTVDAFNNKGCEAGVSLAGSCFTAVILRINNAGSESVNDSKIIISTVENLLQPYLQAYGVQDSLLKNSITFIFAMGDSDYDLLDGLLLEVKNYLYVKFQLNVAIGVGNPYRGIGDLPKAYSEASNAVDYRLMKGSNCIIFNSTISGQSDITVKYPKDELEKLQLYLMQTEVDRAYDSITRIIHVIESTKMPLFLARTLCFDIINTVIKTLDSLFYEFPGSRLEYAKVEALMEFETVEQLSQLLKRMITDICAYIQECREKSTDERIEVLKQYIQQNFQDYNFSVSVMADHFNLTLSNLSHFFKAKAGQNVTDYVNYLRIDAAKKMLKETNLTIQDIVSAIGYINISSFIRKFRQETGMTPGTYREKYCNSGKAPDIAENRDLQPLKQPEFLTKY